MNNAISFCIIAPARRLCYNRSIQRCMPQSRCGGFCRTAARGARETEPNGNVRVVRKKIKHTYLRVYPDGEVVITAPRGTPDSAIERLLNDRADWIRAHVAAARERGTERLKLTAGERVYLFGEALALAFENHPGRPTARRETDRLLLRLPGGEGADYEVRRALLLRYYARALSARVEERLPVLTAAVGKAASRVSIRLMRSRWGSCTPATGAIRLNLSSPGTRPNVLTWCSRMSSRICGWRGTAPRSTGGSTAPIPRGGKPRRCGSGFPPARSTRFVGRMMNKKRGGAYQTGSSPSLLWIFTLCGGALVRIVTGYTAWRVPHADEWLALLNGALPALIRAGRRGRRIRCAGISLPRSPQRWGNPAVPSRPRCRK